MTFDEFVKKFDGKATDFDGGCGVQCVDLAKMYMYYVLEMQPKAIGNAEAYWRRYDELSYLHDNFVKIPNTPTFVPQKGDIAVWDTRHGKYGHIAICNGEGNTKYFYSYDQNWIIKKMHKVKHDYKGGFAGVLRPRNQILIYGETKYKVGDYVEIDMPVKIAFGQGDKLLVDNGENQFWIHKSVIKDDRIIARALVAYAQGNSYILQIFDDQFWCNERYITKKL